MNLMSSPGFLIIISVSMKQSAVHKFHATKEHHDEAKNLVDMLAQEIKDIIGEPSRPSTN